MTNEAIEARRAYKRQWAKDHPESVKRSQARFWEKQAVKMRATAESEGQHDDTDETRNDSTDI